MKHSSSAASGMAHHATALNLSGYRGTPLRYSATGLDGLPVGSSGSDHPPSASYSANYAAYQSDHYVGQLSGRLGRGPDTTPDHDEGYFWTDQDRETCVGGHMTGCNGRRTGGLSHTAGTTYSGNNSVSANVGARASGNRQKQSANFNNAPASLSGGQSGSANQSGSSGNNAMIVAGTGSGKDTLT